MLRSSRIAWTISIAWPMFVQPLTHFSEVHAQDTPGAKPALQPEPAGERFENVRVLSDLPADHMGKVMNIMSAALGVDCAHCHDGYDFASEHASLKEPARKMLEMTLRLNTEVFHGSNTISCHTCHRGASVPVDDLLWDSLRLNSFITESDATPPRGTQPLHDTPLPTEPSKAEAIPTASQLIARYVEAAGGSQRLTAVRTRRMIGERIEANGRREPEMLWQSNQGESRMETLYGQLAVVEGFKSGNGWKRAGNDAIELKSDEVEQIQTEVGVAFPQTMSDYYSTWQQPEPRMLAGRACYAVDAMRKSGLRETLIFEAKSGLLVQRTVLVPTLLGNYPIRVEYAEYQYFDGIRVPTSYHFSQPNLSWSRRVQSVEWGVNATAEWKPAGR